MPVDPNPILVGVAVLAVIAMCVAVGVAVFAGRRSAEARSGMDAVGGMRSARDAAAVQRAAAPGVPTEASWVPDPVLIDRIVRVVALLFIAAVGVVVAVSGTQYPGAAGVYLLLAAGTLFVVFMQDLLPASLSARSRYWIETIGAVAFLTVLVGLTGGLRSPFVVGFFLLIGGASLAGEGMGPIALALASAAAYTLVSAIWTPPPIGVPEGAWIGFTVVALLLLAYVGTVAGGAQRKARDAALRLSRYDPLTGLYNRSAFFAAVDREIRRVERSGRGFCLLMLDLDDLKPVNDTFGHPAGDNLLRAITDAILRTVRATDTAGRYGGDEFIVLLPETDPDGAFVLAEKLRRDMATLAIRVQDRSVRTSVSLGLVAYPEDGQTVESLLSAVDAAMYEAKRRGKNQIVGYTTRTERVATAIGPERATTLVPRSRPRPEESRAAEIGLTSRGGGPAGIDVSAAEEAVATTPIVPAAPVVPPATAAPPTPIVPATPAVAPAPSVTPAPPGVVSAPPVPPAPAQPPAADDGGGFAVPRSLATPSQERSGLPVGGSASAPWSIETPPVGASGAGWTPSAPVPGGQAPVPVSVAAVPVGPIVAGEVPADPDTDRSTFPRIPSMPSLPPQPLREDSTARSEPTPAPMPVAPRDATAGRSPVPPAGAAPWLTRAPDTDPATAPRNPVRPPDRQYIAFPIEDEPER
ncbi:MAG: diguanylate cyclase [Chloroflexota bacterium]